MKLDITLEQMQLISDASVDSRVRLFLEKNNPELCIYLMDSTALDYMKNKLMNEQIDLVSIKMYPDFYNMTGDELRLYFDICSKDEILDVLQHLKLTPYSNLSRKKLEHYAVRQIIETGIFKRISKGK